MRRPMTFEEILRGYASDDPERDEAAEAEFERICEEGRLGLFVDDLRGQLSVMSGAVLAVLSSFCLGALEAQATDDGRKLIRLATAAVGEIEGRANPGGNKIYDRFGEFGHNILWGAKELSSGLLEEVRIIACSSSSVVERRGALRLLELWASDVDQLPLAAEFIRGTVSQISIDDAQSSPILEELLGRLDSRLER